MNISWSLKKINLVYIFYHWSLHDIYIYQIELDEANITLFEEILAEGTGEWLKGGREEESNGWGGGGGG